MLEMVRGCIVRDSERLREEYKIQGNYITANVDASKADEIIQHFVSMQTERVFFILEVPSDEETERRLRKDESCPLHKEIYYIDGLFNQQALFILMRYGELLIHDGLCQFGFGCQDFSAEIMFNKYNVMTLWTNDMERYGDFFDGHGIYYNKNYMSAWDTFTESNPGECRNIEVDGMNIYDLVAELEKIGLYHYETREDE